MNFIIRYCIKQENLIRQSRVIIIRHYAQEIIIQQYDY